MKVFLYIYLNTLAAALSSLYSLKLTLSFTATRYSTLRIPKLTQIPIATDSEPLFADLSIKYLKYLSSSNFHAVLRQRCFKLLSACSSYQVESKVCQTFVSKVKGGAPRWWMSRKPNHGQESPVWSCTDHTTRILALLALLIARQLQIYMRQLPQRPAKSWELPSCENYKLPGI